MKHIGVFCFVSLTLILAAGASAQAPQTAERAKDHDVLRALLVRGAEALNKRNFDAWQLVVFNGRSLGPKLVIRMNEPAAPTARPLKIGFLVSNISRLGGGVAEAVRGVAGVTDDPGTRRGLATLRKSASPGGSPVPGMDFALRHISRSWLP